MSSSIPHPLFLESLPQLSLPPPSVEEEEYEGDRYNSGNGGNPVLSSSLRERSAALAAAFSERTAATSCPGALSWLRGEPEAAHDAGRAGRSSGESSLGTSPACPLPLPLGPGPQSLAALRGSSLTALALLVSRKLQGATGAGEAVAVPEAEAEAEAAGLQAPAVAAMAGGASGGMEGKAASAPSASAAMHGPYDNHYHQQQQQEQQQGQGKHAATYSCSASTLPTATTATTTTTVASVVSSSPSSSSEEDEEGFASTTSSMVGDAAVGPFDLEELSI